MITIENHLGTIEVSENYFSSLIGRTVSSCIGVAGMAGSNAKQELRSLITRKKDYKDQGIIVRKNGDGLDVDIHIIVSYGLNISATVGSIINKVKYTVEESTKLKVNKVNVYVDAMEVES